MKILIVTQYFYPEQFRINDLALSLKKRGHEITVYTGQPNYPDGQFYPGYSFRLPASEIWNGITIIRAPLFPRKAGSMNLALNYISFALFASIKAKFMRLESYDAIYVFETSPITVAFPAIVIKKRLKIPLLMNVQDLWPDNVIAITKCRSVCFIRPLEAMVRYIYSNCDLILSASKSFIPNILKYCNTPSKIMFWPQYATVAKAEECGMLFDQDDFHVVFTGNLGEAQGLEMMVEAAENLRDTKIRWHLIGDGRNRKNLEALVQERHLESIVIFHGRKDESKIPGYLAAADAALLILAPNPVFDRTIPAKLQTYLACGVAVLGCVSGEARQLIQEEKVGIVSKSVTAKALQSAVQQLADMPKESLEIFRANALRCSKQYFDKETLLQNLENYIEKVRSDYV